MAMAAVDEHLIRTDDGLSLSCSRRPSTRPRSIPATSRVIRRAFARMAANTLTPRCGRSWLSRSSARATRRANCSRFSIRSITPARRPRRHRYKVEPYVVAADVYSVAPHVGRGGWTWYTGSAGWMYRAGIEAVLGIRQRGEFLLIDPCIPSDWPGFQVTVRRGTTRYEITVENPAGCCQGIGEAELDGVGMDFGRRSSGRPARRRCSPVADRA